MLPKPFTAMLSVVEPSTVNFNVPLLVPLARETEVIPELVWISESNAIVSEVTFPLKV